MDYEVFLVRLPGYSRPTRNISKLLRVTEHGISISTLSPSNPVTTEYSFENVNNVAVSQTDAQEFSFDVLETNGSSTTHNFVCTSRERLLTTLFNKLDDLNGIGTDFNVKKHSNRVGAFVDVVLRLRSTSLVKMVAAGVRHERRKASNMKKINLQDIQKIDTVGDDGRLVLLYMKSRVWRLTLVKDSLQFALAVQRNMKTYLNRDVEVVKSSAMALVDAVADRMALLKSSPVLYEFTVIKNLEGGAGNQRERGIVITSEHLAELSGEEVIGIQNLTDILGLVVSDKNDSEVILEFRDWRPTQYFIQERDSFIGALADVMGLAKGSQFSIRLEQFFTHTFPDKPLPLYQNECEIYMISRFMSAYNVYKDSGQLASQRAQFVWFPLLKDYACNMHVGDSLIIDSRPLYAVADVLRTSLSMKPGLGASYAVTCCIVLQRLLASRACFDSVKNNPEFPKLLLQAMKSNISVVAYSAAITLRTSIKFYASEPGATSSLSFLGNSGPSSAEAANKMVVLSPDNLQVLIAQLQTHALLHQNALQVLGVLEIVTLALNLPSASDAEAERQWMNNLENSLVTAAPVLCSISRTRSSIMFRVNALLLKTALSKCSLPTANQIQDLARARCVVLIHLRQALYAKNERTRELSASLVYLMAEGSPETRALLRNILPSGFDFVYARKVEMWRPPEIDVRASRSVSYRKNVELEERRASKMATWLEALDMLRTETASTPVFVWNDFKRQELLKFLREEVETYDRTAAGAAGREVDYNSFDTEIMYSALSENNEVCKTIIDGIHLEILVEGPDEDEPELASHWKLKNPVRLFQAVFHSLLVCFTPLYATSNLPEVEPRLAMDALTWIYDHHAEELASTVENLKVVETLVAMLREAIENEHHVFAFKSVFLLLLAVEHGGRRAVFNFVKAGGMSTIIPLMVVSLAKCCKDVSPFECDAPCVKDRSAIERVPVVGVDGEVRMARVPSGKTVDRIIPDGSVDARDAIKWQDDSVPEKLQLGMGLDLLEALLRLSGHDSGAEQFPPSTACQDLTRHEILYHLVQMLLRAKPPFFGRILEILASLFKANKVARPGLYKFGIFEILLWKLLKGDITEEDKSAIVKYLWQTHLHQDPEGYLHSPVKGLIVVEHLPWNESILRLWLPPGLISKLIHEGPDGFKEKLDIEEDSPELIWNTEMKARLVEQLTADLEPYTKARASDPQALFIYQPRPAVVYPELADTIFVAPLYLHNLLDDERYADHPVVDPSSFHRAVLQEYQRILSTGNASGTSAWRQEVPRIVQLTKAQDLVLRRYPEIPLSTEAESIVIDIATPALRVCIAQKDDCPVTMTAILSHAASILQNIAKTREKDTNVSEIAISFALSVLSLGTKVKPDGSFPDSPVGTSLEPALAGALAVLELASATRDGRHLLRDDVRWRKGFWWALCFSAGAAASSPEAPPSPVSFAALDCLNHFSGDVELCYRVVKQGLLLPLLLLTVPTEEALAKIRENSENDTDSRTRTLEQVGAEVLRTLAVTLDQAPEMDPSPRLQFETGILATVIPLAMFTCLKNPDAGASKFMAMATTDLSQPTAIWNTDVRLELRTKVTARVREHNLQQATGVVTTDDELTWLEEFSYDCLADEMVISGVFVKGYATGHWEHFDLPDGRAFLDSLQDYLEANRHILIPPGQQKSEGESNVSTHTHIPENGKRPFGGRVKLPATEEDFLIAMAALGECLRYAVEDSKKGMLLQVRYPLLAEVLSKGAHIPAAQMEVAAIAQVLSGHVTAQEQLLPSPLLPVMAQQLWEGLVSPSEKAYEVAASILDAFLELSQEMPATLEATNYFSSSGTLLIILSLFFDAELPAWETNADELIFPGKRSKANDSGRLVAAQILGYLLLATMGVDRRAKLVKDLSIRRSVGDASALTNGHAGDNFSADVTDMYEISNLLDLAQEMAVQPLVVRTLYQLLPVDILSTLARDPTEACEMMRREVCNPLLVWGNAGVDRCQKRLLSESIKLKEVMETNGDVGLPPWSLKSWEDVVFLRYVKAVVDPSEDSQDEKGKLFSDEPQEGYVKELYMGGFFVDQVLRKPGYDMNFILEDRLVREIRKAVVVAAPSDGARANEYTFDDRRRLLLALLVLFRSRPGLLATSNIDIFFPIYDFIAGGSGEERRGLALPGLLLFQCTVNSSDIADFVVNEDLLNTISSLLVFQVPTDVEGFTGTDPRLCSLMLLLRLVRYSSKATKTALELDLVGQVASIVLHHESVEIVRGKAAEVLSVMVADRRCGSEVNKVLEKIVPGDEKGFGEWLVPFANIRDNVVDDVAMQHFLRHRFPAEWWTADIQENGNVGPVTKQENEPSVVSEETPLGIYTNGKSGSFTGDSKEETHNGDVYEPDEISSLG